LLSDTVGFIRKLPTMLIESFKSTLMRFVKQIFYCTLWIFHTLITKNKLVL
jgi:GTP-binding protein HflX